MLWRSLWPRLLPAAVIIGTLAAVAVQADTATRVDRRLAAAGTASVVVSNVAGEVDVRGWDRPEVRVSGTLAPGVERLDVVRDGAAIAVRVVLPRHGSRERAVARLQLEVPKGHRLEITAVSADIRVNGIEGPQQLRSVSGDIVAQGGGREIGISTVSGEVDFDGLGRAARLDVSTVSGDVELRGLAGELEAASISGDVEASATALQSVKVKTTSGDVTLDGGFGRGASVQVSTVSGDAAVLARGAAGLAIEARSFSGALSTCFGARAASGSGGAPGRRLELTRGDGSIKLRISTVSGEVAICDR